VLKEGVGGKDGVVWLNDGSGDLRRGIYGETKLGLLSVINGKSLEEERTKTGSGTTTNGVEYEETLKTGTVIGQLSDSVKTEINDFLTNGVMSSGEIVSGIFLSGDQLFGVEKLSVSTSSNFIDNGGFQIEEYGSGDVLTGTSFGEKGVESIITTSDGLIRGHLAIGLDTVFQTEEFPTGITDLDTSLTNMD